MVGPAPKNAYFSGLFRDFCENRRRTKKILPRPFLLRATVAQKTFGKSAECGGGVPLADILTSICLVPLIVTWLRRRSQWWRSLR